MFWSQTSLSVILALLSPLLCDLTTVLIPTLRVWLVCWKMGILTIRILGTQYKSSILEFWTDCENYGTWNRSRKGFPSDSDSKESAYSEGDPGSIPGSGRFPWRRKWLPTPVVLPGEFHGQKNHGLQSMDLQRPGHKWATNTFTFMRSGNTMPHNTFLLRALVRLDFIEVDHQ